MNSLRLQMSHWGLQRGCGLPRATWLGNGRAQCDSIALLLTVILEYLSRQTILNPSSILSHVLISEMLQNEEALVLEVRKCGSSQLVEKPQEGFHNSALPPPPPASQDWCKDGRSQGLTAQQSSIHHHLALRLPFIWSSSTLMSNAGIWVLTGLDPEV